MHMFKKLNKKVNVISLITLGFVASVVIFFAIFGSFGDRNLYNNKEPTREPSQEEKSLGESEWISYQGEEGKDALFLLRQKAIVQQDKSGLVNSIDGRKTDAGKREYWAFYVNGKLAPVGAADYVTKTQDKIEWKIERY